ncbi:hypothetical protein [Gimibacter soli]|uniref:Calcium/calmodulin-dependent protein kinase II association-domain domain-containing protein n=1 Tax=Gimibacter soli TaxID=3024400 RepID=A0AAE9XUH8_9PROT|nr:hypothetical protein [Gimibacter soli]WCL55281.1 hypothetical protein PH603_05860 [Gimibacter soli]
MSDRKQFDHAVLRCLTNCWIKGRNPDEEQPVSVQKMQALYAEGTDALDVVHEYEGERFVCRNFEEYWTRRQNAIATYGECRASLIGDPTVDAAGDLAVTSFSYKKEFINEPGRSVTQHATVVWKRKDGEWRIVREHVTTE